MHEEIEKFLMQKKTDHCTMNDSIQKLSELSGIRIPEEEYDAVSAIEEAEMEQEIAENEAV